MKLVHDTARILLSELQRTTEMIKLVWLALAAIAPILHRNIITTYV